MASALVFRNRGHFLVSRRFYHHALKEKTISEPRINDRIRVSEVRLIGPAGEQVGVVATTVALRLAQDADLDLVEVAPDARPPVAKLMDYGKFKYESDMKAREARRNQANTSLREMRFRLKIDPHDYETKKGHVVRFLNGGDKVKVMIMFRGREQSRPEMGVRLLQKLAEDVAEYGTVESMPKQDGRNMVMVVGPLKNKADAKAEQRARAAEANAARVTNKDRKAARAAVVNTADADQVETEQAEVETASSQVPLVQAVPAEAVSIVPVSVEPASQDVSDLQQAPQPAEAQPAAAPSVARQPADAQSSAEAKPAAAKPAAAKPAAAPKPSDAKTSAVKAPAAKAPAPKAPAAKAGSQPAAPKPAAAKPAAGKSAAAKPAAKPASRAAKPAPAPQTSTQ